MLLSIIIPTLNEQNNIGRLIESIIKNYSFDPKQIEVIVINSTRSNDKTQEIVSSYKNVRYYTMGIERSSQRNHGAEMAKGDYLFFVDADMEFTNTLLSTIMFYLNPDNILIVPEKVLGTSLYCKSINLEKQIYENNFVISAGRIMTKYIFKSVGGYNVDMVSGEDWDLDNRIKEAGKIPVLIHSFLKHHESDIGFIGNVKKKIYYARTLKNYNVGSDPQVNPFYRIGILFSNPTLIILHPICFIYLIFLKFVQFGIGFFVFKFKL